MHLSRISAFLTLAWPWLAIGLVAALLVTHLRAELAVSEHPRRHFFEMRASGVRQIHRERFHAWVRCDPVCEAVVQVTGSGLPPREARFTAARGARITILEHGSVLLPVDEAYAPRIPAGSPRTLALAFLVSLVVALVLFARGVDAHCWILSLLAMRPCIVGDDTIEFIDGLEPRAGVPLLRAEPGRAWARVLFTTPRPGYREGCISRCSVEPRRDEKLVDRVLDRSRAFSALAGLAATWGFALVAWL